MTSAQRDAAFDLNDAPAGLAIFNTTSNQLEVLNSPSDPLKRRSKQWLGTDESVAQTGDTPPENPSAGQLFYNTGIDKLMLFDGLQWQSFGSEKFRNYRDFLGTDYDTYLGMAHVQGETPIMKILTGTKWAIDNQLKTFYGNSRVDGKDQFTFHFWDYGFTHSKKDVDLHHKDVMHERVSLVSDTYITETNKATVAAYTSIDNLDQLYDYAKYWKTLETHIEIPAIDQQLITGDVYKLNLGDYNLVLDHTAANVLTVDETQKTIVVKSGAPPVGESAYSIATGIRFTELTTTGTVSAANGDQIDFGYTDSVGSHFYTEIKNLSNTYVSINDHLGVTDDSLGVEISASDTPINGSYKASIIKPSDGSDIRITLTQTGYNNLTLRYPQGQLSFSVEPIMTEAAVDFEANQQKILVYLFKLLQ
ncbi:MAG: hypothetical protein O3A16_01460 [Bacteroidetes bacterium]|nr:hypothetical protein [Bacteroidota bacterium]